MCISFMYHVLFIRLIMVKSFCTEKETINQEKRQTRLLVSGSTCKELGRHHYIQTTSRKLRLKNQQLLWIHKRREDTGHTTVSRQRDRQAVQGIESY